MSAVTQIPRHSIFWLLSAQLAVILPHADRMSFWMMAVWLLCAIWRLAMFRGEASHPGKIIRSILVALGCVGIFVSYGKLGGLDLAVALLILAFSLKLVEVRERRDLYLVFYLAFFIIASAFLFSQSIFLAAYQILSVAFVLAAMIATQHSLTSQDPTRAFTVALKLIAQAVPIMLVFFIIFPRIGPIWSVPSSESNSTTGMSDEVSPGDVAKLSQSSELAFRVEFASDIPSRKQLYWRGMTLSDFNGRSWTRSQETVAELSITDQSLLSQENHYLFGQPIRYSMSIEPSHQHWLFTLPVATAVETHSSNRGVTQEKIFPTNDYALESSKKITQRTLISFESYLNYRLDLSLSASAQQRETAIPEGYNPRSIALAQEMRAKASSDIDFIQSLQRYITEQTFYYSLEPPKLGKHSVDEFLFETRKGYCEHYASAFTFMLRAVGIPARVVIGYQGGEFNPYNNALSVRQLDAHAWMEYWQVGSGWQRLDPTSSIAPDRIEYGMEGAVERNPDMGVSLLSPLYYRNIALIKNIRARFEAVNYSWQKWFVGFDNDNQSELLEDLLGEVTPTRTALLVGGVLAVTLALVAFFVMRRSSTDKLSPELLQYKKFCQKLSRLGVERKVSESPNDLAKRVIAKYPGLASEVQCITEQYVAMAYREEIDTSSLAQFKRLVRRFNPSSRMRVE